MKTKHIKRFFKAYGYEVHVRRNREGEIVTVGNKQFGVSKEDDFYWFDGYNVDGSETVFHDKITPENLFSMIMLGWQLTKEINVAIVQGTY